MPIPRLNIPKEDDSKKPLAIAKKAFEPVILASKKFYQTNPKETLEYAITFFFIILTFIAELFTKLSWIWYLPFGLWILYQYKFNKLKLKRKKK